MVNLRERSDELMHKESRQKYLREHPDRNNILERVVQVQIDYLVNTPTGMDDRCIKFNQSLSVHLNEDLIDLMEKLQRGESCLMCEPITLTLGQSIVSVEK